MSRLNKYKTLIILSSLAAVSSCSWFSAKDGTEDIDDRYMRSQQGPELQVPPTAKHINVQDRYRVPEGVIITNRDAEGKKLSLDPPQLLLVGGDGVREDLEQSNPTVWIRHQDTPFMDYVSRFMSQKNIPVASSSDSQVSTDWITDDDETALANYIGSYNLDGQRHRITLEIVGQNANEISLQARNTESQRLQGEKWIAMTPSKTVASQFLNAFLGFYDSERTKEARERILEEGTINVNLSTNPQGNIALTAEREFLAVWDQLPRVLEDLNLTVSDRDQSAGIYYFNVKEPATGFWAWLWNDDEANPKVEMEPGDYQILVETTASGVSMTFKDDEGNLLDPSVVTRIYPEFAASFKSRAKQ
ncbi:outer membrane protein assembly factor BamC [Kangiella sp.]|uniref:outer membrane protein assembly factor BamC n=1 Tax=Kangiella sp. TaxID=1920245 RepID=UPI001996AFB1|nr:outer membrane protein assembly factor BamC [Kangiella sp.]MBD3653652.1 outer membrane protein assembly factor BamC [Kangiella sp.]